MPSIGSSITEPIPPVGTAGTTYATQLVAFLTEVKTRLEAKVPLSSILIGALDMANNAFTNVQSVGLYEQASQPSTPVGSIQRYNNNLWYVSASGAFQLTDGAALDVSSVAGITGDYGSPNPAQLRFVDADKTYYFYDDYAGGAWADIFARTVMIAAGNTGATRVKMDFAGAGSYTLTLPPTLPSAGNKRILSIDENGDILQDGVSTTSITATQFYHTAETTMVFLGNQGVNVSTGGVGGSLTASDTYEIYISLPAGSVIKSWSMVGNKTTNSSNTFTAQMYKYSVSGGTTALGSAQTNSANAPGAITLGETGTTFTSAADGMFFFRAVSSAYSGGGIEEVTNLKITYTRPA